MTVQCISRGGCMNTRLCEELGYCGRPAVGHIEAPASKDETLLTRLRNPKYIGQDGLREDAAREIERLTADLNEAIRLYDGALNMLKPVDVARWQTTPVQSAGVYAQVNRLAVTDEWKRGWDECLAAVRSVPETPAPQCAFPGCHGEHATNDHIDWGQYALNDGSYCMHVFDGDTRYCGRGERWPGHCDRPEWPNHKFVPGCPPPPSVWIEVREGMTLGEMGRLIDAAHAKRQRVRTAQKTNQQESNHD